MAKNVVGLFDDQRDAQQALQELQRAGFSENNLTFVDRASDRFAGMLTNAGIPDQDARIYAQGVQQGGALIILQALADRDAERAADILDRFNVVDISNRLQGYQRMSLERTSGGAANTNLYQGGEVAIPIIEEELRVSKREVQGGGVRVNTRIEEVPVNEQVTLRDETVDVQRRRVDRPVSEGDLAAIQQGSFEVRETDEQAIVDKQARVVEEVVIDKDVQERTETIQDTVRRTDVDVDQVQGGSTLERGASSLGNTTERLTGSDIDDDGDIGRRGSRKTR